MKLDMDAPMVSLGECEAGLFIFNGNLGFKSEYATWSESDCTYRPDAYVVESGEYFWGGAKTSKERSVLLVQPVDGSALVARVRAAEAETTRLRAVVEKHAEALRAHEAWEADIILHADWGPDGMSPLPTLTQAQMDALNEVQNKRNSALAYGRAG